MVGIGQKLIYLGKSGAIRAEVVVFEQKWLYSGKSCCTRAKLLYSGKNGCIRAKVVVFGKVVKFGQK